jgi:hypothetical protein
MARKRLAVPTARAGASSVRQRLFECLRPRQCPARPSNVDACATRWPSSPPISGIRSEAASPHRHPIRQRRSSSRSAFGPSLRRHGHVFPRRDFNGPEAEDATDASGARALLLLSPSLCIQHWAATTWSASSAPRLRALLPLRAGAGAACSSHRPPSQRGQFRWPRSRRSLQWIARCSPPPHFIGHEDPPERAWRLSLAALDGQTSRWRARCRSSTAASNSLCAKPAATHIARLWSRLGACLATPLDLSWQACCRRQPPPAGCYGGRYGSATNRAVQRATARRARCRTPAAVQHQPEMRHRHPSTQALASGGYPLSAATETRPESPCQSCEPSAEQSCTRNVHVVCLVVLSDGVYMGFPREPCVYPGSKDVG